MAATPLLAVATVALGLRLGASARVRAAIVRGAAPAKGRAALAWQVQVLDDELTVREAVIGAAIEVRARAGGGEATWRGTTDGAGFAEADLALGAAPGQSVELEVRGGDDVLARGAVVVPPWRDAVDRGEVLAPATRREGRAVDVAVLGQRIVASGPVPIWIRAWSGGAAVALEVEEGLAGGGEATACGNGWAEIPVVAQGHVAVATVRARAEGAEGAWYGPLPVAPGGALASAPMTVPARAPFEVEVVAPPARRTPVYAEIDDVWGRAFASTTQPIDGRVRLTLPPLAPGRYWLVTSADALGAETLAPGALARPFEVADRARDRCDVGPALATAGARTFPKVPLLDGLAGKRARQAAVRARGRALAFAGLALGAVVEAILVVTAAREGGMRMRGLTVIAWVLLALLGFAMIAALVGYGTR